MTRRRTQGFTLVELLIAAAILVTLLGMLGSIFLGSQRAYRTNEGVSNERQNAQALTELLQYEVGLSGYRCVDSVGSATGRVFSGSPLTVVDGAGGTPDRVTVRYYEDRFTGGACDLKTVTFYVEDAILWRSAGTAAEPAVNGVVDLQVSSWLDKSNVQFNVPTSSANLARPNDRDLAGLGLTLVLEDSSGRSSTQTVTIGLKNPQCSNLADCL